MLLVACDETEVRKNKSFKNLRNLVVTMKLVLLNVAAPLLLCLNI